MIQLTKQAAVEVWDISATIATNQKRPEFLAVVQLAQHLEQYGQALTPQRLCWELLGNLPEALGRRVLARCEALDLLKREPLHGDEQWTITTTGQEALGRGDVLIPQSGVFRFWISDEPLLPSPLLHVAIAPEQSADKEFQEAKKHKSSKIKRPNQWGDTPPKSLRTLASNRHQTNLLSEARICQLLELGGKGSRVQLQQAPRVEVTLTIPKDGHGRRELSYHVSLKETAKGKKQHLEASHPCDNQLTNLTYQEIWEQLVAQGDWNQVSAHSPEVMAEWRQRFGRSCILLPFGKTTNRERRQQTRHVKIRHPILEEHIGFKELEIDGVPIVPLDEFEAQKWSDWLQSDSITDYLTRSELSELGVETSTKFTMDYPGVRPKTPEELFDDALAEQRKNPKSWLILAAADLGMWEEESHV